MTSFKHFFHCFSLFKKIQATLGLFVWLGLAPTALAGIGSDLKSYFNDLGFASNATAPQAYQGQQAGYYTGGSLMARNTVRNVQIASVKLPSYQAGCSGIDLYGGAISFVSAEEMKAVLRSLMSSAGTFAFNLMLESTTPQIANTANRLMDMANKINQSNINSCETAAALVGSVWPKTQVAQRHVCAQAGMNKNIFTDYALARQGCGIGGQSASTLKAAANDEGYEDQLMESTNLAWKALRTNAFLQKDNELAELFMSLSGSIIFIQAPDDKSPNAFHFLPSLATNQEVIKALLESGEMSIYRCDKTDANQCLNPTLQSVTIQASDSLTAQVRAILTSMVEKLQNDKTDKSDTLTKAEEGFLNATHLPVYKMLTVQTAYTRGQSPVDVTTYADMIAADILFQYLEESLQTVQRSATALQAPQEILTQFQDSIHKAIQAVQAIRSTHYQDMNLTLKMIEDTQALEKLLAGQLSTELNSTLAWSRSIH